MRQSDSPDSNSDLFFLATRSRIPFTCRDTKDPFLFWVILERAIAMETPTQPIPTFDLAMTSLLLASRCRAEFQADRQVYDFLANPFHPASVRGRVKTESTQLLHKLLSPLFRSEIVPSHYAVDRSEPFALGIEMVVRYLGEHRRWTSEHARRMVLQSLMPIYLASAQNKIGSSVAESMTYFRETIAITLLDKMLECELSQWLIHEVDAAVTRN